MILTQTEVTISLILFCSIFFGIVSQDRSRNHKTVFQIIPVRGDHQQIASIYTIFSQSS